MMTLLIRGLALWRLADLMVNTEGPGRVFVKLREATGVVHDEQGNVFGWTNDYTPLWCVLCTNVWLAPLVALAPRWLVYVLSLSAIATLLEDLRPPPQE